MDAIRLTTPNGAIVRIKASDCLSAFQRLPGFRIDVDRVDENDNVLDHLFEYSKNLDKNTGDGALPNGDTPYNDDSYLAVAAAYIQLVSRNTLRNDAPTGGVMTDGAGNIIGVDLSAYPYHTVQGYPPNTAIRWSVGAGGAFHDDHILAWAQVNPQGNITPNSFNALNGQRLNASNPILPKNGVPWQQNQWFRMAPPPLTPGEAANLDFGTYFLWDWQPSVNPAPGSCYYSSRLQTNVGGFAQVGRVQPNGKADMRYFVSDPTSPGGECGPGWRNSFNMV